MREMSSRSSTSSALALHVARDDFERLRHLLRRQRAALQQVGPARDRVERRAQLVADGRDECVLLAVGGGQPLVDVAKLGRAPAHAAEQHAAQRRRGFDLQRVPRQRGAAHGLAPQRERAARAEPRRRVAGRGRRRRSCAGRRPSRPCARSTAGTTAGIRRARARSRRRSSPRRTSSHACRARKVLAAASSVAKTSWPACLQPRDDLGDLARLPGVAPRRRMPFAQHDRGAGRIDERLQLGLRERVEQLGIRRHALR